MDVQEWFQCRTCSGDRNEGCCVVCARVCHVGHDLAAPRRGRFFCDCGAGVLGKGMYGKGHGRDANNDDGNSNNNNNGSNNKCCR